MKQKTIPNPYGVSPNSVSSEEKDSVVKPIYKNNTLAITSLVLGILSILFYFLTAIPGIITGHLARSKANKMPDLYEGKGMALAGLILSYIMLVVSILFIVGGFYLFDNYPEVKEAFMEGLKDGIPKAE